MYRTVVTICTASLTFNNSTFCPHSVFMCFVWIWEQTAIISLYSINWLVFITETECVYCAVRTGSLISFPMARHPQWARASSSARLHDHTQTHHSRQDSSGRGISPTQRPVLDNTQHSQQTDIHASGGIRTRNPSKVAVADPRPTPRGHQDRQIFGYNSGQHLQFNLILMVWYKACW